MKWPTTVLVLVLVLVSPKGIADLFDSQNLALTLSADFSLIREERDKSRVYPAVVRAANLETPLELEVRGNNRLLRKTCAHPPLRLLFKKDSTTGTAFEGQSELKLVVQCRDSAKYRDYLRTEFLIYRTFANLTERHFKTVWVTIEYRDTGTGEARTAPAFLIERKKDMGKRLDLKQVKLQKVSEDRIDTQAGLIADLFQFMIGNTDYSIVQARDGEDCCHNTKLMEDQNADGYVPIPYDFDQSGLVNASYAKPPPVVPVQRVVNRYYRGFCSHLSELSAVSETFQQVREDILALYDSDSVLSGRAIKRTTKYIAEFYKILASEQRVERTLYRQCRE